MTDREAAQLLTTLEDVLILTHRRPDGDTIGCAAALCLALRQMGKTAYVLPNEDAHHLFDPYFEGVLAPEDFTPKNVVSVDTAALGMLPKSAKRYQENIVLAIDHHGSNEQYAQHSCVDAGCAACGELIFRILPLLGVTLTAEIALPLYMAVATDTGCFVYSNTTPQTHRVAAALMETGFDAHWVNKRHFRVKSRKRVLIENRLVEEMDLYDEGTLAFAYVTQALVREFQASEEDLDDISSFIGLLSGVVHSATVKELKEGGCKVSLRTDAKLLNASHVCARFGGGGHPAAAGCMIRGTPKEVRDALLEAIQAVRHG